MDNGRKMTCQCGGNNTVLLYSCSGAADVGEIADQVTRQLRRENLGKMTCLAALGADLTGFIESARGVCTNITIDGCGIGCAKKNLEKIGVTPTSYILTEMGLKKGETRVTTEIITEICEKIKTQHRVACE